MTPTETTENSGDTPASLRTNLAVVLCALSLFALAYCVLGILAALLSPDFAADFENGTDTYRGLDWFWVAAITYPASGLLGLIFGRGPARIACAWALAAPGWMVIAAFILAAVGAPLLLLGGG